MRKIIIGCLAAAIIGVGAWGALALDEAPKQNENGEASVSNKPPAGEAAPSGRRRRRAPA